MLLAQGHVTQTWTQWKYAGVCVHEWQRGGQQAAVCTCRYVDEEHMSKFILMKTKYLQERGVNKHSSLFLRFFSNERRDDTNCIFTCFPSNVSVLTFIHKSLSYKTSIYVLPVHLSGDLGPWTLKSILTNFWCHNRDLFWNEMTQLWHIIGVYKTVVFFSLPFQDWQKTLTVNSKESRLVIYLITWTLTR